MNPVEQIGAVIAKFDLRTDSFAISDVETAIAAAIDRDSLDAIQPSEYWAELGAYWSHAGAKSDGGAWFSSLPNVTAQIVEHWSARARLVVHPILAARYADLVWDLGKRVTGTAPDVAFAQLAIDSYIKSLKLDAGQAWGENRKNVERVLQLAMSIRDDARMTLAVDAIIDYSNRTSEDDKIGTYCYVFELLILPKRAPPVRNEDRDKIVKQFESRFAEMTKPGGLDLGPYAAQDIGRMLVDYYKREGRDAERKQTLLKIGQAFEHRASIGDAISGMHFLEISRRYYVEAGDKREAERVMRAAQELAPQVKGEMVTHRAGFEIPSDVMEKFLRWLTADGVVNGLWKWTYRYIPNQSEIKKQKEQNDRQHPIQALFAPTLMSDQGITASVDDTRGDVDGPMVYETYKYFQLHGMFMSKGLDHLIDQGLTAQAFVDMAAQSPIFEEPRLSIIRRVIDAHISGDYVQSIHLVVPQLERALVVLVHALGGTSMKTHRSGRGVSQSKSLNDALTDGPTRLALGEDVAIYLTAVLSHPKGMNVRNLVCHGIMEPAEFTKRVSERMLHALATLSLLRTAPADENEGGAVEDESPEEPSNAGK